MAKTKEASGEQMKPPGHSLLEKMANHTGDMLKGVAAELPMVELPHQREAIKSYCGGQHKAMCDMIKTAGIDGEQKSYGIKEPEWPESMDKPKDKADTPEVDEDEQNDKLDDDEMKDDLPEDEADMEAEDDEEMPEEEEKSFEAQIKAMEEQAEMEDALIESAGVRLK